MVLARRSRLKRRSLPIRRGGPRRWRGVEQETGQKRKGFQRNCGEQLRDYCRTEWARDNVRDESRTYIDIHITLHGTCYDMAWHDMRMCSFSVRSRPTKYEPTKNSQREEESRGSRERSPFRLCVQQQRRVQVEGSSEQGPMLVFESVEWMVSGKWENCRLCWCGPVPGVSACVVLCCIVTYWLYWVSRLVCFTILALL